MSGGSDDRSVVQAVVAKILEGGRAGHGVGQPGIAEGVAVQDGDIQAGRAELRAVGAGLVEVAETRAEFEVLVGFLDQATVKPKPLLEHRSRDLIVSTSTELRTYQPLSGEKNEE